jgi:hypothetical protein
LGSVPPWRSGFSDPPPEGASLPGPPSRGSAAAVPLPTKLSTEKKIPDKTTSATTTANHDLLGRGLGPCGRVPPNRRPRPCRLYTSSLSDIGREQSLATCLYNHEIYYSHPDLKYTTFRRILGLSFPITKVIIRSPQRRSLPTLVYRSRLLRPTMPDTVGAARGSFGVPQTLTKVPLRGAPPPESSRAMPVGSRAAMVIQRTLALGRAPCRATLAGLPPSLPKPPLARETSAPGARRNKRSGVLRPVLRLIILEVISQIPQ